MNHEQLASYLRSHRRRAGLSQRELSLLLGFADEGQVSRHERLGTVPHLLTALSYQAIFCVAIADIFPGFYEAVKQGIEERLAKMEEELQGSTARGRKAALIARKLEWLWERRNPNQSDSVHEL